MRINALGNTATDFASDDYIAIDGATNGSRKMKNDSLLKVTAQNALVGGVAPAFDPTRTSENPYKAGESVTYEDNVYTFKVDHYGAWAAADVIPYISSSATKEIDNELNADKVTLTAYQTDGNYYLDSNGYKVSNNSFSIAYFNLVRNEKVLHIKCRTGVSSYIWMYDENGIKIKGIAGNAGEGINFDEDVILPYGVKSVKISYSTSFGLEVYQQEGIAKRFNFVEKIADGVNKQLGLICLHTKTGYYLNSNAVEVSSGAFNINDYNVDGMSSVHVECRSGISSYLWFYDSTGAKISGSGLAGNAGIGINFIRDISVPVNAVLMRVSNSPSFQCVVVSPQIKNNIEILSIKSELKGKKIGLIGDSIAAGSTTSDVSKRFINVCATRLCANVDNHAIGGYQFCDHENTGVYRQVANLSADDDLIVIFAGTNDYGHAAPIGDVYTTEADGHRTATTADYATTTCGGIHKAIEAIYTKYGYKPIVICTPIQRKFAGRDSNGGSWDVNTIGKYLIDYIKAIKGVAEYWGIPVFDAFSINMQPMVNAADTDYFADGLHPKDSGHRLLGESLAKYLTTIWVDDTIHSP